MKSTLSPQGVEELKFTIGGPCTNAQGEAVEICAEQPYELVHKLKERLDGLRGEEAWFCAAVLCNNYRRRDNWLCSRLAVVDVDYRDENGERCELPEPVVKQINEVAMKLPGNLAYLTPRGFRLIYVFDRYVDNLDQMRRFLEWVVQEVEATLKELGLEGFEVDRGATVDPVHLMYAPCATVDGHTRNFGVEVLRSDPTAAYHFDGLEINPDAFTTAPRERNASTPRDKRKPLTRKEIEAVRSKLDASPPLAMPDGLELKHGDALEMLGSIPSADYHDWIDVGQILHHETSGSELGLELWDRWSQRGDGGKYEPGACAEKWCTLGKNAGGVGWGTAVHLAKHYGYGLSRVKPEDAFDVIPDEMAPASSPETREREKLLYTIDELAAELGAVEFLVSDVLVSYGASIFHATRKAGKSTVVVSLAMHLASGATSWCGRRIEKHGRTVYISGEGTRGLISRFRAAARELRVDPVKAVRITKRPARITIDGAPNAEELAAWSDAIAKFQAEDPENPVRLIVVDTLSRNIGLGADECKEADAKAFMESLEGLAEAHGCAALVVHHQPHAADRSRGSTALEAHAEVILSASSKLLKSPVAVLTRHGTDVEKLETDAELGEAPPAHLVELKVVAGKEVAGGLRLRGVLEGVELEPGKPTVARFRPLRAGENSVQGDRAARDLHAETRVLGAALLYGKLGTSEAIRRSPLGTTPFREALKRLEESGVVDRTMIGRRRVLRVDPDRVRTTLRSGLTEEETLKLQGLPEGENEPD